MPRIQVKGSKSERIRKTELFYNRIGAFEAPKMGDLPRLQIQLDMRKGAAISYSQKETPRWSG